MREFRAWIMPYEMMVEVQRINFDVQTVEVQIGEGDLYEFDFEEIELMRSTGLKDKNGVEIYEGDILETWNKRYDGSPFSEKYENDLVVVKHNLYEGYLLHYILKFCGISNNVSRINEVSNYRVVGNIHENPELLEELNAKQQH
jgi:uncharacterized phage protein (TIGR01671 family)